MKKLRLIFLLLLIMVILPINILAIPNVALTPAHNIGDVLGNVLHSNVRTYINGERIPSYNINHRSVVLISDLANYGFDVVFDEETRTSTVTRNYGKEFMPIPAENIADNTERPGTVAFQYVYTDIIAIVNGIEVESFNIKGRLAIFFGDLGDFGTFRWNGETQQSLLTLDEARIVITPTGIRYHFHFCHTIRESWQYVTREEARELGFTACQVCEP